MLGHRMKQCMEQLWSIAEKRIRKEKKNGLRLGIHTRNAIQWLYIVGIRNQLTRHGRRCRVPSIKSRDSNGRSWHATQRRTLEYTSASKLRTTGTWLTPSFTANRIKCSGIYRELSVVLSSLFTRWWCHIQIIYVPVKTQGEGEGDTDFLVESRCGKPLQQSCKSNSVLEKTIGTLICRLSVKLQNGKVH